LNKEEQQPVQQKP
jgi:hypothetical protein